MSDRAAEDRLYLFATHPVSVRNRCPRPCWRRPLARCHEMSCFVMLRPAEAPLFLSFGVPHSSPRTAIRGLLRQGRRAGVEVPDRCCAASGTRSGGVLLIGASCPFHSPRHRLAGRVSLMFRACVPAPARPREAADALLPRVLDGVFGSERRGLGSRNHSSTLSPLVKSLTKQKVNILAPRFIGWARRGRIWMELIYVT